MASATLLFRLSVTGRKALQKLFSFAHLGSAQSFSGYVQGKMVGNAQKGIRIIPPSIEHVGVFAYHILHKYALKTR